MFFLVGEPILIKIHTLAPLWLWSDDIMPVVVCMKHMIAADDGAFWQPAGWVTLNLHPLLVLPSSSLWTTCDCKQLTLLKKGMRFDFQKHTYRVY